MSARIRDISHSLSGLPPLDGEAVPKESCFRDRFGETISILVLSGDGGHSDVFANVGAEEMEALIDVLGPGTILGIVGNLNGTTVVLKHSAMHCGRSVVNRVTQLLHLLQNPDHR